MRTRRLLVAMGLVAALAAACSPGPRDQKAQARPVPATWSVLAHGIGHGSTTWLDVDATALDDIWVAGLVRYTSKREKGYGYPAVAHWDGGRWTVHVLKKARVQHCLGDIDSVARDDVWLMLCGVYHFDGRSWRKVSLEGAGHSRVGLSASPAGAWLSRGDEFVARSSGGSWTRQRVTDHGFVEDVAVLAENDVWAVGNAGTMQPYDPRPLAAHWDGKAWHRVPMPRLKCYGVAVSFSSPRDGWLLCGGGWHADEFFVVRWDGASWKSAGKGTVPPGDFRDQNLERRLEIVPGSSARAWLSVNGQLALADESRMTSRHVPMPKRFTPAHDHHDMAHLVLGMCVVPGTDVVLAAGGIWQAVEGDGIVVHDVIWRNG